MCEQVYLIGNPSILHVKLGSGNTKDRLKEANDKMCNTWMPTQYRVLLCKEGFPKGQHIKIEKGMHKILDDIRVTPEGPKFGTEWFHNDFDRIKRLFDAVGGEYVPIEQFEPKTKTKISLEDFKRRVLELGITSTRQYFDTNHDLPNLNEIEDGYYPDFTSISEIMGWTVQGRR